jgi:hypothetical protein
MQEPDAPFKFIPPRCGIGLKNLIIHNDLFVKICCESNSFSDIMIHFCLFLNTKYIFFSFLKAFS